MNSYDVTDPETGTHIFTATGHLFKAIPCVDSAGIPTADDSCGYNTTERTWASCTAAPCHGDATAAVSAFNKARNDVDDLVQELDSLLQLVAPGEFSDTDTLFTVAEGAKFNLQLGQIESSAIHNPFMTEALLDASIDALHDAYPALVAVAARGEVPPPVVAPD